MNVENDMTREVITVKPTASIKDVARVLVENKISGVPVVDDDGRLLGVVTEGDLVMKEAGEDAVERRPLARVFGDSSETRAQLAKAAARTAGEAMTSPAITVRSDEPLAAAAALLHRNGINRLPVVDDDTVVGIISRADIVRAFARPDEEIAQAIREDVLSRTMWMDPARFDVTVTDGKAHIAGGVERRSEAEIIERITAMVPGVTGVTSDLTWSFDDRDIKPPARDLVSPY